MYFFWSKWNKVKYYGPLQLGWQKKLLRDLKISSEKKIWYIVGIPNAWEANKSSLYFTGELKRRLVIAGKTLHLPFHICSEDGIFLPNLVVINCRCGCRLFSSSCSCHCIVLCPQSKENKERGPIKDWKLFGGLQGSQAIKIFLCRHDKNYKSIRRQSWSRRFWNSVQVSALKWCLCCSENPQ